MLATKIEPVGFYDSDFGTVFLYDEWRNLIEQDRYGVYGVVPRHKEKLDSLISEAYKAGKDFPLSFSGAIEWA